MYRPLLGSEELFVADSDRNGGVVRAGQLTVTLQMLAVSDQVRFLVRVLL